MATSERDKRLLVDIVVEVADRRPLAVFGFRLILERRAPYPDWSR